MIPVHSPGDSYPFSVLLKCYVPFSLGALYVNRAPIWELPERVTITLSLELLLYNPGNAA